MLQLSEQASDSCLKAVAERLRFCRMLAKGARVRRLNEERRKKEQEIRDARKQELKLKEERAAAIAAQQALNSARSAEDIEQLLADFVEAVAEVRKGRLELTSAKVR